MATAFEGRFGNPRKSVGQRVARSAFPKPKGIPRKASVRRRGKYYKSTHYTISEYLIEQANGEGDSKLELEFYGAAMELHIPITRRQVWFYLPWGGRTRADYVADGLHIAIYVDGYQHELRPEIAYNDKIIAPQLRSMGWRVAHVGWREIFQDPYRAANSIYYAQ